MSYTFWHSGILIGESDLEQAFESARHRGGVFRPTAHGLSIFPRLTGILTATHLLKTELEAKGRSPDNLERAEIEEIFDTTAVGKKIVDIGRTLSDIELRAADGRRLEFSSIAFSDLWELQRLLREMAIDPNLPLDEVPEDERYVVSATFTEKAVGRAAVATVSRHGS